MASGHLPPPPPLTLPSAATDAQLSLCGLPGLEKRWRRDAAARAAAAAQLGGAAAPDDVDLAEEDEPLKHVLCVQHVSV